ncbi:MAG TPA: hypothetical protein VF351_10050 [Actinomycetota bacterium]
MKKRKEGGPAMIFGWSHELLRTRERELRCSSEHERAIRDSSAGVRGGRRRLARHHDASPARRPTG